MNCVTGVSCVNCVSCFDAIAAIQSCDPVALSRVKKQIDQCWQSIMEEAIEIRAGGHHEL